MEERSHILNLCRQIQLFQYHQYSQYLQGIILVHFTRLVVVDAQYDLISLIGLGVYLLASTRLGCCCLLVFSKPLCDPSGLFLVKERFDYSVSFVFPFEFLGLCFLAVKNVLLFVLGLY